MYFYLSLHFKDDQPLASLPLLGYTVSFPSETDNIIKDFVFKLQFKNADKPILVTKPSNVTEVKLRQSINSAGEALK